MRPLPLTAVVAAAVAVATAGGGLALLAAEGIDLGDPVLGVVETAFAAALLGLLVLWQRPRHRMGAFLMAAGLLFGVSALCAGILESAAGGEVASRVAFAWIWLGQAALILVWTLIILALPEGEVGRGLRRGFLIGASLFAGAVAVAGYLFAGPGQLPEFPPARAPDEVAGPLANLVRPEALYDVGQGVLAALPLLALLGLIGRFRRADPVARQQLKWVLIAAAAAVLVNVLRVPLDAAGGSVATAGAALGLVAEPLPTLGIALAVLRYRLWELDVFISRALVYGALWLALSAAFLAVALGVGLLAGGSDVLMPLLLALVVALAAQPARSRLERVVRRLVYGREPVGYAVVVRYGERLAEAAGAQAVASAVSESVRRALGVSSAGVWVHVESGGAVMLRPVAVEGAAGGAAALMSSGTVDLLLCSRAGFLVAEAPPELSTVVDALWSGEPAAVVPLLAGEELVGLVACGDRPRRPLGPADLELLGVLAREAALALRNVRLEAELRARLEEIEEQAEELRRSRRRLVRAQDAERRRIERDLHDGVQQQLVALAARLRRASLAAPADVSQVLEEASAEAEESVFALQELARGIYPSLLADNGLGAALRTQAARLPAAVRVESEPALAGRRFGREVEAALYFVGLEAMANAQKHAPGSSLTVSVRSADQGRRLVLEIHDDGPGFRADASNRGAGLQNMEDRVAAAGGVLSIDSRRGAGTWIRAEVPLEAPVLPIQRLADDSRR